MAYLMPRSSAANHKSFGSLASSRSRPRTCLFALAHLCTPRLCSCTSIFSSPSRLPSPLVLPRFSFLSPMLSVLMPLYFLHFLCFLLPGSTYNRTCSRVRQKASPQFLIELRIYVRTESKVIAA